MQTVRKVDVPLDFRAKLCGQQPLSCRRSATQIYQGRKPAPIALKIGEHLPASHTSSLLFSGLVKCHIHGAIVF